MSFPIWYFRRWTERTTAHLVFGLQSLKLGAMQLLSA